MDHNRCILCTRCVRVCDEIEGAHTWDVMGRGIDALVITDLARTLGIIAKPAPVAASACTSAPRARFLKKGKSVAEMLKRRQFLPYLT